MIENEFGAVSIDEALVKENLKVAEEVISLDNGCACCTVRGDLMKALNTFSPVDGRSLLMDLPLGMSFDFNGKVYTSIEKKRTRLVCEEIASGKST